MDNEQKIPEIVQESPDLTARTAYKVGMKWLEEDPETADQEVAEEYLEAAIYLAPFAELYLLKLSEIKWLVNKPDEAFQCIEKAVELIPFSSMVYYYRGNLLRRTGKLEEAITDFESAIYYYDDPEYHKAIEECRAALSGKPSEKNNEDSEISNENFEQSGDASFDNEEYEQAAEFYSKQIDLHNKNGGEVGLLYKKRGQSYSLLNENRAAINDFWMAIKINPNDSAVVFHNRGDAYYCAAEYEKALKDYEAYLRKGGTETPDEIRQRMETCRQKLKTQN